MGGDKNEKEARGASGVDDVAAIQFFGTKFLEIVGWEFFLLPIIFGNGSLL